MRALGIDTADLGVEMTTRKILDAEGRIVVEVDCPQTLTAWERLYRILRDAFPAAHYHRGVGLKGFEQSGAVGDGAFERRPQRRGRSADRRRRHPLDRAPAAAARPQSALCRLCRLARAAAGAGHPAGDPPRAVRVHDLLPAARRAVPRLSGGRARTTICAPATAATTWSGIGRPTERTELQRLLTDESGVTHSISIPPPLIRQEHIAAMRAAAERLVAPQFRAIARLMDEPVLQPIYDLETPRMAFGRVAIIGDAAFVARPHVGAGVSKACDDALALADALAPDDVEPALRALRGAAAARRPPHHRARAPSRRLSAGDADRGRARPRRPLQHRAGGDRRDGAGGFPRRLEPPESASRCRRQIAAVVAASKPVETTCSIGSKSAMSNG